MRYMYVELGTVRNVQFYPLGQCRLTFYSIHIGSNIFDKHRISTSLIYVKDSCMRNLYIYMYVGIIGLKKDFQTEAV